MTEGLAAGAPQTLDLRNYTEQVEKLKTKPAFSVLVLGGLGVAISGQVMLAPIQTERLGGFSCATPVNLPSKVAGCRKRP